VRAEFTSLQANRKQAQMAFMVDGPKLEKFTVTREGKLVKTERRLKLTKGAQQIGVAYLHEQGKPAFEPADGANGGSSRNFPFIGVQSAHYHYSHHEGRAENLDALQKIDTFYAEQFAYLVKRLKAIPEAGGTLLDRCLLLYGSPLRDGNKHDRHDLPVLFAGGGGGLVKGGRCVHFPVETPMANTFLTMLDAVKVHEEHFSDSNGRLGAMGG